MRHSDGAVLLLPGRVPQLRLHGRAVLHAHVLRRELHADRRTLRLRQLVLQVPAQQACLAHGDISNENDYKAESRGELGRH